MMAEIFRSDLVFMAVILAMGMIMAAIITKIR